MSPWLAGFLVGLAVGFIVAIFLSISLLRRWMISSTIDSQLTEQLVARLAKGDRQVKTYKEALEQSLEEVKDLRDEKLRKWDIPDEF